MVDETLVAALLWVIWIRFYICLREYLLPKGLILSMAWLTALAPSAALHSSGLVVTGVTASS